MKKERKFTQIEKDGHDKSISTPEPLENPESVPDNIEKIRGFSKLTVGIIITLIVLLLGFLILFRLNFMVDEQLRISLTPEYSELNTTGSSTIPFVVDTKLYNKFVCDAVCNYTLTDISHDILLDEGSFSSKAYKNEKYSFNIPLDYFGYGINTYLYRVECVNIRTTICPSDGSVLVRKSLFVVRYEPSVEQLSAADFSKKNYVQVLDNMVSASVLLSASQDILLTSDLPLDKKRHELLRSALDALRNDIQSTASIWKNDDYISTKSLIVNNRLLARSRSLISDASSYNTYIVSTIKNHNMLLDLLKNEQYTLLMYRQMLSYNLLNMSSSSRASVINSIIDGNSMMNSINGQYDYTSLYANVSRLHIATSGLDGVLVNSTKSKLVEVYPALYVYSNMLCMMDDSIKTINHTVNNITTTNTTIVDTSIFCGRNYGISASNNISDIGQASIKLRDVCSDASLISDTLMSDSIESSDEDSKETLLLQYKLLLDYESLNGQNSIISSYRTYITNVLKNDYNISDPEVLSIGLNVTSSSLKFNNDNLILSDIEKIKISCSKSSTIPTVNIVTAKSYTIPTFDISNVSYSDRISHLDGLVATLPESIPQCCMYGKCQSCERKPSKNPLILLHGHSFNQNTLAYNSIEIFNGFEQAFSHDKLYFQTGIFVKSENSTKNILGHYYVPLVSRPTYYLETYNDILGLTVSEAKDGNIDTYALRLKESIDYTLYITGSDKVDVVAHSMGGLVLRRYMQIFGTGHIGTVILVATPNQGVSDRTYNLCKIFGAVDECEDMRSDGLFIKKLNDLSNEQSVKETYLVVGRGCDTDGVDGDGVVSVNNSLIKGISQSHIFYVDGKCGSINLLHNDMLNPVAYPEVYDYVKDKLE